MRDARGSWGEAMDKELGAGLEFRSRISSRSGSRAGVLGSPLVPRFILSFFLNLFTIREIG